VALFYADVSALAKLGRDEPESQALRTFLADADLSRAVQVAVPGMDQSYSFSGQGMVPLLSARPWTCPPSARTTEASAASEVASDR